MSRDALYGVGGIARPDPYDFNKRYTATVVKSDGKGRITFRVNGMTDGLKDEELPEAWCGNLNRPNGGSTKNVANLYPPTPGTIVHVEMHDEHNVRWFAHPFQKHTFPPECEIEPDHKGKLIFVTEDGVVLMYNQATGDFYFRNPIRHLMIRVKQDINVTALGNMNFQCKNFSLDAKSSFRVHSPSVTFKVNSFSVVKPYSPLPDTDQGKGVR